MKEREFLKNKDEWLYVTKEGKVYEIERDVVLQNITFRPSWRVSLKNMELFKDA